MDRPLATWNRPRIASIRPRTVARLLLGGMLAAVMACGGGGGGNSGPTAPPPQAAGITFTAAGSGGVNTVSLASGASSSPTTLVLEVRVSQVQDFYGVAFNLSYPNQLLHFDGVTEGTFLNGGGAMSTNVQTVESPAGNLIVGMTRLGAVAGAQGTGVLITLRFSRVGVAGQGTFAFLRNTALSSFGTPLSGLTWTAGTVTVTL